MKCIADLDVIQIEITNACTLRCANCTRLVGHHAKPFMMTLDQFKEALDSVLDAPNRIGITGGEPLIHPQFPEICEYIRFKVKRGRMGLWTTFPKGKEHYREMIVKTFNALYLNDHSKPGIMHAPLLVAAEEVAPDRDIMWYWIDRCWVQNTWSASITPNGAYFCEVAAAFGALMGERGWEVKPGWWKRTPKDYIKQMEKFCVRCGAAMPLKRRESMETMDDVSPDNMRMLEELASPKARKGDVGVYRDGLIKEPQEMFQFSELEYRQSVAAKYGIKLIGYVTPYLEENPSVVTKDRDGGQNGQAR